MQTSATRDSGQKNAWRSISGCWPSFCLLRRVRDPCSIHFFTNSIVTAATLRTPIEQTVMDLRQRSGTNKLPENIRQFVLDDVFWQDIEAVVHLLRPLAKAILLTEGDISQPGLICHIFQQIKIFTGESNDYIQHFGRDVQQQLLDIWQKRADFCLSDIHVAANILDPRFRGELLSEEEDIKDMQFIVDTASKMTSPDSAVDFQMQIFVQLGEFKTMTGAFFARIQVASCEDNAPSILVEYISQ